MISLKTYIITESFKDSLIREFKQKIDKGYWNKPTCNCLKTIIFGLGNSDRFGKKTYSDFSWDKVEGPNASGEIRPDKIENLVKMFDSLTDYAVPHLFIAMKDFDNFYMSNGLDDSIFIQNGKQINKGLSSRGKKTKYALDVIKDKHYTGYLYYLIDVHNDARSKQDERFKVQKDIDLDIKNMRWKMQDIQRKNI